LQRIIVVYDVKDMSFTYVLGEQKTEMGWLSRILKGSTNTTYVINAKLGSEQMHDESKVAILIDW